MAIRETLAGSNAGYLRHPAAAAASSFWSDGKSIDAGFASIVTNDFQILRRESVRHLFSDVYDGNTTAVNNNGWDDTSEPVPASAERTGTHQEIAWLLLGSSATARLYGPFTTVHDRDDDTTNRAAVARIVHVEMQAYGTSDMKLYAAATAGLHPPSDGTYLALGTFTLAGTGSGASPETVEIELTWVGTPASTRPSGAAQPRARTDEYYVWVGWRTPSAGTHGILSACGWELHESGA